MAQRGQAQTDQLKALMKEFKRVQKKLQVIHKKTGYADLDGGKFLKTHRSEDLETALKALTIAEGFAPSSRAL